MNAIILVRGPLIDGSAEESSFFNEGFRCSEVFIFWFCEFPKTDFENDENHFEKHNLESFFHHILEKNRILKILI